MIGPASVGDLSCFFSGTLIEDSSEKDLERKEVLMAMCSHKDEGKARRRKGKERKDRTGATRWGAHHRPVNTISSAVSSSFRAMSLCDNCRIKSTHYCVTAFRGGRARYYGHSVCPRNGDPTRCRADIVLRKDSSFGPIASELMEISAERRRRVARATTWQISLLAFPRRWIESSYRASLFFRT